jgi:hypothetical protein
MVSRCGQMLWTSSLGYATADLEGDRSAVKWKAGPPTSPTFLGARPPEPDVAWSVPALET